MATTRGDGRNKAIGGAKSEPEIAALTDASAVVLNDQTDAVSVGALLDVVPAAIYVTDAMGRVTYYNQAAAELAGRQPTLGEDEWCVTWRLFTPDGRPLAHDQCPMAIALREDRAVRGAEAILERPDGTRIPFVPYPTPLHDASGRLLGAVNLLVDISERKAAEKARGFLAAVVESSDDAIVSKTLDGVVTSWNRGAEVIFGYRADEMIGQPIIRLFPPDRLSEEDLILDRIRRGERVDHFETVRRCKDGREINVSVTISPVRDAAGTLIGASKIARDITEKKRAEAALRNLNEELERRVAERTTELAEANNRLMTEIAERERTEAQLLQAQKMEALGQLVAGLAHDFNNLLAVILGNLELLDMRLARSDLQGLVHAAARSARHGATLNDQLLAFSRKQHLMPQPVDLNELVINTGALLIRTLGSTVEVDTGLAPDLWPAFVDPHQLELVILNLAINARDAMPMGGRVLLQTRNVDAGDADRPPELPSGEYVSVAISDTGTGMSPEVLARACEPFFTTKEPGRGSGLGLAQVYGLARQSGGGLRIVSALGEGTTVTVYLPRSDASPRKSPDWPEMPRDEGRGRRGHVLVVDDNDEVRDVLVAYLETLGYHALQAASGEEALDLLATYDGDIELLVADYAMPGMSGADLMDAAHRKWPAVPVVILTGYADMTGVSGKRYETILLRKPFTRNEFAAVIERALHGGEAAVEPRQSISAASLSAI